MNKKDHRSYWCIISLILGSLLLSSCAKDISPYNLEHIGHVDDKSAPLITARLAQESKKIFQQQQELHKKIDVVKPVIHQPVPIEPVFDPLDAVKVSVDVDNGDVQNVLRAISDQAGMSLLLDPELSELKRKITMHLQDVPASMVFRNVMKLLDLSGTVKNNVMIVMPFEEHFYNLDFIQSTATMDFNVGGDVFGANSSGDSSGGSGGDSSSNGMSGNLSMTNTGSKHSNAYDELDKMLMVLVGKNSANSVKKGQPGVRTQVEGKKEGGEQSKYSLNRMTGTLYVRARPSQVNTVTRLIDKYKQVLQRQILIEAQILDVSLSEQYQYGVDWAVLRRRVAANYASTAGALASVQAQLPIINAPARTVTLPATTFGGAGRSLGAMYSDGRFTTAINMLRAFGTVRVLSNPSIRAQNAHPAFISVGKSSQYIAKSSSTVTNVGGGATTTTADVTTSSVFDGIVLGVEPFISDNGKISLTIHPMQSAVDSSSLALIDVGGGNKVTLPVIDFKGMTTALSMNSGDTVILGGLINETGSDTGDGIPGLTDLPLLGSLFGGRAHDKKARELIIVLRVIRIDEPDL